MWSSLRYDDELRPLVEAAYRAWIDGLVEHIHTGRRDGSIPDEVDPRLAAWRLAAVGDGLDSMLYLELLDRGAARDLMRASIRRELAAT